ncbi:hypothetical protein [Deinococcus arcticus]|uniref:Uncharacterized protein n=1 Tax=Deinococcus arcticus TaxID=2136176 RepID=A0A2T3WA51_9DEIO|nr:hypothetical protein [Deinococcus arcticus]PTA68633.1 hypothetical protein C8263_05100 [Deinococcus arcticus]
MSVPPPAASPGEPPAFPTYRLQTFAPAFALGWGLGAALTFGVRALGGELLGGPCSGRTLLALLPALLLGPGGLAFTAAHWRRPARAALGLGLVVASLLPALFVGAQDIAGLRRSGCAGGYVVLAQARAGQPAESIRTLSVPAGQTRVLQARIGGFTPQSHPGPFTVEGASPVPGVRVAVPRTPVRVGDSFTVTVQVDPRTPVNSYTLGVRAVTRQGERPVEAAGTLELNVRPATP